MKIKSSPKEILTLFLTFRYFLILLFFSCVLISNKAQSNNNISSNIKHDFDYSLEELLNLKISISSFTEESILDAASTVSVVNETTWRQQGAKNLLDLLQFQPSMKKYQTFTGAEGLSVRGFTGSLSIVRGHALLIDGVSTTTYALQSGLYTTSYVDLNLMKKAEFLLGPGSILYGSDAFHSVTALKSWDSEKDVIETGIRVGSFEYNSSFIRSSTSLTDDIKTTLGLSYVNNNNSSVDFPYLDEASGSEITLNNDEYIEKISTMFKLNAYGFSLIHHGLSAKTDEFVGTAATISNQEGRRSGGPKNEVNFTKISYDIDFLEDYHFSVSGFDLYSDKVADLEFGGSSASAPESTILQIRWPDSKTSGRLDIQKTDGEYFTGSTGVEITQYIVSSNAEFSFNNSPSIIKNNFAKFDRKVISSWINTVFKLPNNTHIVAGIRGDDYDDIDDIAVTSRLGIIYRPIFGSAYKILYGEAFRAPAGTEQAGSATVLGSFDIKPEIIETYELIYMRFSNDYRMDITAFQSSWKEGITIEVTPASIAAGKFLGEYVNSGENSSRGIEFNFDINVLKDTLDFSTSGSYVESKNDKNNVDYGAFPTTIFNWGLTYRFLTNKFHLSFMNRHEFKRKANPDTDARKLKDYFRSDIGLTWMPTEKLEASLNIIDLFNVKNRNPSVWSREKGLSETGIDISSSIRYTF
ncbi:MAG: TonB-dependent receptor [Flavobacteriales bacterium]|nr:TonB-dependent receptor [Flavobacteriales bacterium]